MYSWIESMNFSSYGICYSSFSLLVVNCNRLPKFSALSKFNQLLKPSAPTATHFNNTFFKIYYKESPIFWLKCSASKASIISAQFCERKTIFPGTFSACVAMSSTKRALEGGVSPPSKIRLCHTAAQESESNSLEAESCTSNNVNDLEEGISMSEGDSKEELETPSQTTKSGKKLNTARMIRYKIQELEAEKVKQSCKNFDKLLKDGNYLEELNSIDTTFGSEVRSSHEAASVLEVKPCPITPEEEDDQEDGMYAAKKKKKMFAVLISYSGKGFYGLQHNPPHRTIEGELLKGMVSLGLLSETECNKLQAVNFQRAARTDKGVSAARQVVSVKLPIGDGDESKVLGELNSLLPPQIRLMDIRRATRSFNSKNWCDCRTYSYLTPTYAFAPMDQIASEEYRISEATLAEVRQLMSEYVGTRNFHNFTIKKKATEANAYRFIQLVEVDDPFVREGVQWVLIRIKGQSFMMHQIRKMIGLVMSICRGLTPTSVLAKSFTHDKIETPKAPGLGLVLEQPHYDSYNKRFGEDGTHKPIDWSGLEDQVSSFRKNFIDRDIIETEIAEKSMLEFLRILHMYSFTDGVGSGIRRADALLTSYLNKPDDLNDEDDAQDQINDGAESLPDGQKKIEKHFIAKSKNCLAEDEEESLVGGKTNLKNVAADENGDCSQFFEKSENLEDNKSYKSEHVKSNTGPESSVSELPVVNDTDKSVMSSSSNPSMGNS